MVTEASDFKYRDFDVLFSLLSKNSPRCYNTINSVYYFFSFVHFNVADLSLRNVRSATKFRICVFLIRLEL
jgi:hypothetical protein